MKEVILKCDNCGNVIPDNPQSDFYTVYHKQHYMIPSYNHHNKHFCTRKCIGEYYGK